MKPPSAPLVSVILPVLNRAQLLASSAGSVLTQDYRNLELIIVDDGSEEDLEAAARALSDSRVRYLRRPINGGPAAARNTGIEAANGELIAFQDSDDQWLPGKLSHQVQALLAAGSNAVLAYTDVERSAEGRRIVYPGERLRRKSGDLRTEAVHCGILFAYTQSWLVRRSALLQAGPFDPSFRRWEDWELCIRLSRCGDIVHVPNVYVVSRRVDDSITNDMRLCAPALRQIIERHMPRPRRGDRDAALLLYTLARFEFLYGERHEGWRALRQSLRVHPLPRALMLGAIATFHMERRVLFGRNPGARPPAPATGSAR
jgi:glycosyltransferase involved in cell wall biosynthesis